MNEIFYGPIYSESGWYFNLPSDAYIVETNVSGDYMYSVPGGTSGSFGLEGSGEATVRYTREYKPDYGGLYVHNQTDKLLEEAERQCGEFTFRRMLPAFLGQILHSEDINEGWRSVSNSVTLFIGGKDVDSGNIPLYIQGHDTASGNVPLYIAGHDSGSTNLNMFLLGPTGVTASGNVNLFVRGAPVGTGEIFRGLDLFIEGATPTGSLNLFLMADANPTGSLPLYIAGKAPSVSSGIPLYVANSGLSNTLSLFIEGKQLTVGGNPQNISSGWIPATGAMSMVIWRNPAGFVPMYIAGHSPSSGNLNLFVQNNLGAESGLDMFVQGKDTDSGLLHLYINGNPI